MAQLDQHQSHPNVLTADGGVVYGVKVAWWGDGHTLWREELDTPRLLFRFHRPGCQSGFSIRIDGVGGFWSTLQDLSYLWWLGDHLESLGVDQSQSMLRKVERRDPIPPAGFTVEGDELEAMLLLETPYYLLPNHLLQQWAADRWLG